MTTKLTRALLAAGLLVGVGRPSARAESLPPRANDTSVSEEAARERAPTSPALPTPATSASPASSALPTSSPPLGPAATSSRIRFDPVLDGTLAAGSLLTAGGLEVANRLEGGGPCRWCDRDGQGNDTLNGFDARLRESLVWKDLDRAQLFSNLAFVGLFPATLWPWLAPEPGFTQRARAQELGVMTEAVGLALLLNQTVKFSVRRERPFVHELSTDERARTSMPWDNNTSFFSQHSSVAFALVSSAATLGHLRKSRWAWAVTAGGGTLACAVAYLRMAGGKHYASDVLAGAASGTAIGIAVPWLHRETAATGTSPVAATHADEEGAPREGHVRGTLSFAPNGPGGGFALRWTALF